MAYKPPFESNNKIEKLCIEIAELVDMVDSSADFIKSSALHRKLRIKTIHSSLLIEGNNLDEKSVTAIMDGKRVLGDAHDILEIENAKKAYELIPKLNPYSIDDLLKCHRVMMKGLVPEAGCFRSKNVGVFDGDVLIHAGTPAAYVPEVVADIFDWLANTDMHPLLASCVFHCEFEFIHPFSDGNGRCGRLWHTLLLSHWRPILQWLPVESTIRKKQQGYYAALAESESRGSSEAFVEFALEVIYESLLPFAKQGGKQEVMQDSAISFLKQNPNANIDMLVNELECSKRTAERLVAKLKSDGKLRREGSARSGKWIVL